MIRKLTVAIPAACVVALLLLPGVAQAAFGLSAVEGSLETTSGQPQLQAGAHPDLTTTIHLNGTKDPETGQVETFGNPKDIDVTLPPGLIGNPTATPKCTQGDLAVLKYQANCDPDSQVGIATVSTQGFPTPVPIYNMVPPTGVAGQFAFNFVNVLVYIDATVTGEGEYSLRAEISNISQGLAISDTSVTLWGIPASPVHDLERTPKGKFSPEGSPVESGARELPFIDNPTSCTGAPLRTEVRADSWQAPGAFEVKGYEADPSGVPTTIVGCAGLPFEASMEAQPTTTRAESPTGLTVNLGFAQDQAQFPEGLTDASLRSAVVTLPEGMAINPAAAGGLGSCGAAQIGLGSDALPSCPEESRIGSVQIETPLLETPLNGGVYLAQPRQNKFGSLLGLYLVVDDPVTGVLIKIPGKIETDPSSGRVVARFDEAPQLPFSNLHLQLFGGSRAALLTPSSCGTYSTTGTFAPWSGTAPVEVRDSFAVTAGPNGEACPGGRFDPTLEAGMVDPAAGDFSPFDLRIARSDGSGRLSTVSVRLPQGLLAKLAGIPYCSDAALAGIPTGEGTGAAQFASPSCSAASKVGTVAVAAGAGQTPLWVKTGSAYLAGPYKGAPLSLAIVTPALAGPFDLGNVVVRVALRVNPETAQVTADADPLPTILSGIPLDLREIRVSFDREGFTLNPTSCARGAVSAVLTSTGGATANPSSPFAASGCEGLGFAPNLTLALKGGTRRGAFPQLTAKLKARPGQANLARVAVQLPRSEFLAQGHIGTVCTRVQFAADQCPENSIYGYAEAQTPLLSQPLSGPVYLRSSSNKLPDLVVALRGQINIDLDGRIDSHNRGIRTTFETIPDAPISSFTLRLKGGKKSLLENSTSLCQKPGKAQVSMLAQNGAKRTSAPLLAAPCRKKRR